MKRTITVIGLVAVIAAPAFGAITTVLPPSYGGELSHEAILEAVYSGDFAAVGPDFIGGGSRGSINAVRYDDVLTDIGILDVVTGALGSAADQIWTDGVIDVEARARYAAYSQQFGFDRGSGYEYLFDVSGYGTAVSGEAAIDLTGDTWHWGRRDSDGSNAWYSHTALNRDDLDHMVTYRIHGLEREGATWMLFWEDLPGTPCMGSDRDFNDLAVEVHATPEPVTLMMLFAGGLVLIRRTSRPWP